MLSNSQVGAYTYPTSGGSSVRPHAATTAGSNSYTYDANGNMLTGAGRTFNSYDVENHPTSITSGSATTTFAYDGDGGRVKKQTGSSVTWYISKLYECDATTCTKMIWSGDRRILSKTVATGALLFYHGDHLGSTSVVTDSTGANVQALTYYPFGATRTNVPGNPDVVHKYTGKELDATGLYWYEWRSYDPVLARFTTPDTLVPNPRDPQDLNRYSYVGNNPLRYTDPTGHFKLGKFLKGVFKPLDTFLQNNAWARWATWAVAPGMIMNVDPSTRTTVWAAGAAAATGGALGIHAGGLQALFAAGAAGAAGGASNATLNDGNILRGTLAGGASGLVAAGLAPMCTVLCAGAAAGAMGAAISGGDPGQGAMWGTLAATPIFALQIYL